MTKLRSLRTQSGMTQKECATAIGVSRSAVAMWEAGLSMPKAKRLSALAALFQCRIDELFYH